MHVVGRELGGEEARQELAHLALAEGLTRLDRGTAGVGRGETLQPVGPPAEAPAGEPSLAGVDPCAGPKACGRWRLVWYGPVGWRGKWPPWAPKSND